MYKLDIKKIKEKYKNISDSTTYAYIGVPSGYGGLEQPFYGTYDEFLAIYPNFKVVQHIPVVLYMHGSSGLFTGDTYRRYIVEDVGALFFAPHSFRIKNRPTYKSPTKHKEYLKVHQIRQVEIECAQSELMRLDFIDIDNIFLMGNSEGGLAAAIYQSNLFKGRIITAFSCESSYFIPPQKSRQFQK